MRLALGSFDFDSASALNELTNYEGLYQYVQNYRNAKGIGGKESIDWALRSMEQTNRAFKAGSELRDKVGFTLKFLQDTFARVQAAGDNRPAVQSILNEVKSNPDSQSKEFKVLISFIEGQLSGLPAEPQQPVTLQAGDQTTCQRNCA